jgi:hypothetical protein
MKATQSKKTAPSTSTNKTTKKEHTKVCSLCKRKLPISDFGKCSSTKDGLQYYCKACQKLYRQGLKQVKTCTCCGDTKPIYEFYQSRITDDGLFDMCKDCCKTYSSSPPGRRHYERYFSTGDN